MPDFNIVNCIIQGGSVGVAVLALGIMYRLLNMGATLVGNHLTHITEALGGIAEKLDRLIDLGKPEGK